MPQSIEVTTHIIFRDLLRHQPGIRSWHHHLTMARLVAQSLRTSRSLLVQTGIATHHKAGSYRLSYLIPALLWPAPITIAMPLAIQDRLITTELPQLQHWLGTNKPVYSGNLPPKPSFTGIWITDPQSWLKLQLDQSSEVINNAHISNPIVIDGADDLENWAQALLTIQLVEQDWEHLRLNQSAVIWEQVIAIKIRLMASLWQRPLNPYHCYLLDERDRVEVESLAKLVGENFPPIWQQFYQALAQPNRLLSAQIDRTQGTFRLAITPTNLIDELAPIWERQLAILITSAVDLSSQATGYRQELGLGEMTSVKFPLDRHHDRFQLYLPRWMPMPNTSKFQSVLVPEIQYLLNLIGNRPKFVVILIQDTPLQAQLAAILAAEWGSRVQVEQTNLTEQNILVSGWEFWQQHQDELPTPQLLIIATLPIPSLEDPLVAAKVSSYKHRKQDWFRLYLLPTGLRTLHRAVAPVRSSQGIVAIFDNRIDRRIYGQQVLTSLGPFKRISYADLNWLDR
jgi:ATP-dependent DNA helicase DinG